LASLKPAYAFAAAVAAAQCGYVSEEAEEFQKWLRTHPQMRAGWFSFAPRQKKAGKISNGKVEP
jgi:hypothetical protein